MTEEQAVNEIALSNEKFCHSLYKILKKEGENLVFSPLSAHLVLMMAYAGAREKTTEEMEAVLQLPRDQNISLNAVQAVLRILKGSEELALEIANKIFIQEDFKIKDKFQKLLRESFSSEAEALDFRDNPSAASSAINKWVKEKTREKILELLKADDITSDTKMILVNAIYFKSKWLSEFSVVGMKPFHTSKSKICEASMISIEASFNYAQVDGLKSQVLELRYQGDQVCMLIILPNEVEGLSYLEDVVSSMSIKDIYKNMKYETVDVTIPKFELEDTINLNDSLEKLGMKNIFTNDANFSGIAEETLKVSKVLQKAFISVNEYGTEAAAATYLHMVGCCAPMYQEPPKIFNADHPFMFTLVNRETGTILFWGTIINPHSSD